MFDSFVVLGYQHNHFITVEVFTKSFDRVMGHPCRYERLQGLVVAVEHFFDWLTKLFVSLWLSLAFVILIDFKVLKSIFLDSKGIAKTVFGIERFQLYRFNLKFKVVYSVACESN